MEESDGCGDHEKKEKMRKECYVNKATWIEANMESVQMGCKPQFMLQAATNTRGQSVKGKGEPPVWDMESIPPHFQSGFRQQCVSEFYSPE